MSIKQWFPTFIILTGLWSFNAHTCSMSEDGAKNSTAKKIEEYLQESRPTFNKVLKVEHISNTSAYVTYSIGKNKRKVKRFFKVNFRPDCTASLSIGRGRAVASKPE